MEHVAPRRRRDQRSPTPTKQKRSPHSPHHRESKREEKSSRKKKDRKRSPSSPSSSPSSLSDESSGILLKKSKGEDIEGHMLLGRDQPITDVDVHDVLDEERAENEQARAYDVEEPLPFDEAQNSKNWMAAMQSEYDALIQNDTWTLCDLPLGKKAICTKWVYKLKPHFGWDIHQSDIVTAFLNGDIFEEVYVTQPRGFVKKGQEDKVILLISGPNERHIAEFKADLNATFKMKNLGLLHHYSEGDLENKMGEPSSSWQNFNFRDDEGSAQGMQALRLLLAKLQEAQANPRLKPSVNNLLMTKDLMLTSTQRLPSSVAPMHLEGGEGVPVMHGPMQANVVPHPLQGPLQTDGAKKKQYHGQERHVGKIREEGDFHDDDDEPPSRSRHKKRTNERRTKRSRRNSSGGSSSSSQSGRSSHGRFPKKGMLMILLNTFAPVIEYS
ncbi:hypothetical protein L7F22_058291 [Adiantum nelumboides]|nr:hypothetical protein [Adiantum nelumboides]